MTSRTPPSYLHYIARSQSALPIPPPAALPTFVQSTGILKKNAHKPDHQKRRRKRVKVADWRQRQGGLQKCEGTAGEQNG
ncbi:hypothetical protein QQF64_035998 [Cirrhinus molitorella]|uniref:Uncharacterized protein n=1 Tax=Cirrhinus molitorella TaxID=172907 RepID=A0ABR3NHA9_9TELE